MTSIVQSHIFESHVAVTDLWQDSRYADEVEGVAERIVSSMRNGGKVMAIGNGGSAADAQHFVAELVGRYQHPRAHLPALALTTDTSVLTAVANDYNFDTVFSRQVAALGKSSDVLLAISTSGRSRNVLAAVLTAKSVGMLTVGLTGDDGGELVNLVDLCVRVPSRDTPIIQQLHMTVLHAICAVVDEAFGS